MQAISGALQMSGGIILLLVRQPVFSVPPSCLFARACSPCCRSARGGWERLWFVADAAAGLLLLDR
jgi:hypothetical protein